MNIYIKLTHSIYEYYKNIVTMFHSKSAWDPIFEGLSLSSFSYLIHYFEVS